MTRNSRRLQKAVQAIFNDYREKASCPGQVYQNAACGCDNALQMWRGPKGEKGDQGPQGPKGDNAGSFLVNAEFVVDPEGQEPGAYLKLVLIDVAQQEQVVYVDLSYLTDIYTGGNGISITDMVVAARLGAGLTFDANGNIASAYQFCDGLDETSNVVKVRLDSSNRILGFASGTCGGLTATVGLAPSATGVNLVLTGADGAVLSTVPLEGGTGITVQKNAQTGGFTWLADPAGLVSSQTGNQLSVSQTDNKLYVGGNTLEYTFGTGAFTLKDSSGATLSSVTVPSAVRMLENMELRTDDGIYLHLTYLRDNGLHAYQDVSLDELLCNNVDTVDDTAAAYSKAVPSGNWQTASINEIGGRTVVWNQLGRYGGRRGTMPCWGVADDHVPAETDTSMTVQGQKNINYWNGVPSDHKLFVSFDITASQNATNAVVVNFGGSIKTTSAVLTANTKTHIEKIGTQNGASYKTFYIYFNGTGDAVADVSPVTVENFQFIDLTLMFGAGNEPATVDAFRAMFPTIDPAYNPGQLISAGVTGAVSVGKNLWDAAKSQSGWINPTGVVTIRGAVGSSSDIIGDYIPVIPSETICCSVNGALYGALAYWSEYAADKSFIQRTNASTCTPTANTFYVRLCLSSTAADAVTKNATCQLERGSTATAYTPYRAPVTLPIPAAVQSLPGYGWSAGSAYNYVDWQRKVYVQKVRSVDLGTLDWFKQTNATYGDYFQANGISPQALTGSNAICGRYTNAEGGYSIINTSIDKAFGISTGTSSFTLRIRDSAYSDKDTFKSAMQGVMLQYELATPIETDISSLLTDTTIEVEPGGSLTFANQHGDDFRLPVPNSETFIYEHPWVFEDCVKGAMQPAIDALNARIDDISVELTLDAGCREVTVEPATAEPFDDYLLSGSINTLLLEQDGTISDLKHANAIPDSSAARGSVTVELFNPESTDGLSIELYAKQSSGSDSRNYYSNVDPEADAQKCATLADFLAAGEQGLPLTYADEISFSGVTPFAENETLYASVVSNGNNSYTFTFTVRTSEVKETQLVLDLVSGENRTDLKPLLEHVGGKVDMVAVPSGDAVQLSFGYAGAGYIFGSRRSDFPTVGLFANSAEDICAQTNLIQPTSVGPGADTFTYYFETLPTHFAIPSISEVDATGTKVGTTSYAPPMLDMETMRCTGEGTVLADIPEAGLVYTEYDTSSRPFVPTGRTLRLRATVGNAGIVFTLWQQETVDKPVLCLEPSCDSCIDLSPLLSPLDSALGSIQGSFSCDSLISDSISFGVYYNGQSTGMSQYADFGGSLTIGRSNVSSFYLSAGVSSSDGAYLSYGSGNSTSDTTTFASLSVGSVVTLTPRDTVPFGFPAEIHLVVTAIPGTNQATFEVQDSRGPMPTLTLTSTLKSGNATEQYIDMSCLADMIDEKTVPIYQGATASAAGVTGTVPPATSAQKDSFLKGDGTWEALPTNHVTTDTDQDITGTKTFVGQKKIAFKQSVAADKLGFTLFDRNGAEVGYLEYNPSNSGKVNGVPVMTLGNYATKAAERSYVGFRRYSSISGAAGAYNLLTPLIVDARTPFNLTTTYTNFYLLLGVSDGTNMYTVGSNGVLDLSAMIPTGIAHLAGAETFTGSKTFGAGVYGNAVAMSTGAIDVSAGTVFTKTIAANTTISFTNVPAAPATACVTLILTNGGAYTVTWPSSVKWSDGTAPDLTASGVDVLTFLTIDGGTTWYGTVNSLGAA